MVAAGSGRTSDGAPLPPGVEVRLLSAPDDGWTGVYLDANADGSGPARLRLAVEAPQKKAYASITVEGVTAAIGLGVVLDGTLGVFDVVTAPTYRRRGLARLVMGSLRRWGADAGATSSFLQVHGGNAGAIALYESLGFTTGYTYVYLVPPPTTE
jgi:GNAT superfamily N-acetyltransferase